MSAMSSGKINLTNKQALKIIELRKKANSKPHSDNRINLTNKQALKLIELRKQKKS